MAKTEIYDGGATVAIAIAEEAYKFWKLPGRASEEEDAQASEGDEPQAGPHRREAGRNTQ
jgi:hypothetical protein